MFQNKLYVPRSSRNGVVPTSKLSILICFFTFFIVRGGRPGEKDWSGRGLLSISQGLDVANFLSVLPIKVRVLIVDKSFGENEANTCKYARGGEYYNVFV